MKEWTKPEVVELDVKATEGAGSGISQDHEVHAPTGMWGWSS